MLFFAQFSKFATFHVVNVPHLIIKYSFRCWVLFRLLICETVSLSIMYNLSLDMFKYRFVHRFRVGRICLKIHELANISNHFQGLILREIQSRNNVQTICSVSNMWICNIEK